MIEFSFWCKIDILAASLNRLISVLLSTVFNDFPVLFSGKYDLLNPSLYLVFAVCFFGNAKYQERDRMRY